LAALDQRRWCATEVNFKHLKTTLQMDSNSQYGNSASIGRDV